MGRLLCISLIMLTSLPALAQQHYAQQTTPQPQQYNPHYAPGTAYAGQPAYAPHYPNNYAAQPPAPAPREQPYQAYQERPSDYGRSVVTDIRQMNF